MIKSASNEAGDKMPLKRLVHEFASLEGRQPRVMLSSRLPLDGDERIQELAVLLADVGFDVDIGPYFKESHELVVNATENDVDVLILSKIDSADQMDFKASMKKLLNEAGRSDLVIVPGAVTMKGPELVQKLETILNDLLSG